MDARLRRFIAAHLLTVVGEWAVTVGVLVHAFQEGGARAVGPVSLAVLAPPLVCAPLAARLAGRYRAERLRVWGMAIQGVAYGAATAAAAAELPVAVVAACVVVGLGAINTLRPTGAVLLPASVTSTELLVRANLRISWCDSSSALVGPLVAAAAAGLGGTTTVFGVCAGASAVAAGLSSWHPARSHPVTTGSADAGGPALRGAVDDLRSRPWTLGVLGMASARNIVIGGLDVLLVVVALDALDLGERGPGLLSSLVGAGALASTVAATLVVRRSSLRPALVVAGLVSAALCLAVGTRLDLPVVLVVLPVLGLCASLMDNTSRMLLQRSTDPRRLGSLFAVHALVSGAGQVAGSLIAQVLLATSGSSGALIGLGAVLAAVVLASVPALRRADDSAEVPVVEMSLLVGIPMFAPLTPLSLEAVARSATYVTTVTGEQIVRQGDEGDTFYAVVDGDFDVVMNGAYVRTARRGSFFGEVALLKERPRTATVTATRGGTLLALHREPFLVAVMGHELAHRVALDHVDGLDLDRV